MDNTSTKTVSGIVGIEKFYRANLLEDTPGGTPKFSTPKYVPAIKELGLKVTINTAKNYAENILWESDTAFDSTEVTIKTVDLLDDDKKDMLGHKIAEGGGIIYNANDKGIAQACLFKTIKGNGKARYVVLYNNTFQDSDESVKGKEGKTEFQESSVKATGAALKSNGMWKYTVDEEDGMTDEKFFKQVIIPKELTYVAVEYTDYTEGEVTDISVYGVTFNKESKKFLNVPSNVSNFKFKLGEETKTATKSGEKWTIA